jgi:hypothetical protein
MHDWSSEGASHFRARAHMTPKKVSILLRKYRVNVASDDDGKTYESSSRTYRELAGVKIKVRVLSVIVTHDTCF